MLLPFVSIRTARAFRSFVSKRAITTHHGLGKETAVFPPAPRDPPVVSFGGGPSFVPSCVDRVPI